MSGRYPPQRNLRYSHQQLLSVVQLNQEQAQHHHLTIANNHLKHCHRGASYPVKDLESNQVIFTSQNHGFEVKEETLNTEALTVKYRAINDGSIEGLQHKNLPAFSVQFQPEAAPGSEDAKYIFDDFIKLMKQHKGMVKNNG